MNSNNPQTSTSTMRSHAVAIQRVRRLHHMDIPFDAGDIPVCSECNDEYGDPAIWPCPTIRAVNEELER